MESDEDIISGSTLVKSETIFKMLSPTPGYRPFISILFDIVHVNIPDSFCLDIFDESTYLLITIQGRNGEMCS